MFHLLKKVFCFYYYNSTIYYDQVMTVFFSRIRIESSYPDFPLSKPNLSLVNSVNLRSTLYMTLQFVLTDWRCALFAFPIVPINYSITFLSFDLTGSDCHNCWLTEIIIAVSLRMIMGWSARKNLFGTCILEAWISYKSTNSKLSQSP